MGLAASRLLAPCLPTPHDIRVTRTVVLSNQWPLKALYNYDLINVIS